MRTIRKLAGVTVHISGTENAAGPMGIMENTYFSRRSFQDSDKYPKLSVPRQFGQDHMPTVRHARRENAHRKKQNLLVDEIRRARKMSIRKHSLRSESRLESEKRGQHRHIPGVSHSTFAACESPSNGEEYRPRGVRSESYIRLGDKSCPEEARARVAECCSSLARFLDQSQYTIIKCLPTRH